MCCHTEVIRRTENNIYKLLLHFQNIFSVSWSEIFLIERKVQLEVDLNPLFFNFNRKPPETSIWDSSEGYFAPFRRSKPLWDLAIIVWGGISRPGPWSPCCPDWSQVWESPLELRGEDGVGAQGGADHAGQTGAAGARDWAPLLYLPVDLKIMREIRRQRKAQIIHLFIPSRLVFFLNCCSNV